MGSLKSLGLEGFLLGLYANVFVDLATLFPEHRSTLCRDFEILQSRVAAEGVSFLTKTLPSLGKTFDQALDTGSLVPHPSFKKEKGRMNPAFLRGLFRDLFDASGSLVNESVPVIMAVRQICFLAYKIQLPYTNREERRVVQTFVSNEEKLANLEITCDLSRHRDLIARVLKGFNPKDILPRHGPGAVSTGEKLEKKWEFSRLYSKIHQHYPYYNYFVVGSRHLLDRVKWYRALQRDCVGKAKVVLVPKDSRGPRLISKEPLEYQWIQQGFARALVPHLEENSLTGGRINFRDQEVNGSLALESSRTQIYCTLDMKDASDLVSKDLVEKLFPESLVPYLMAIRSDCTELPDGSVVPLRKYAPMGSAVCFPVEALVFWVFAVIAVSEHFGWDYSQVADLVYVYGDDIIVPTVCFDKVVQHLEEVGLVVNLQKCCRNGRFRESCGVDAYNGIDVTPLKMSTVWSSSPRSPGSYASYSAYANSLADRGYHAAAAFVRNQIAQTVGILPHGTDSAGYPCISVDTVQEAVQRSIADGFRVRYSTRFQRYEVRVRVLQPVTRSTTLDSWSRLLSYVCGLSGRDPDRVTLPRSVQMKWAWRAFREEGPNPDHWIFICVPGLLPNQ